MDAVMLCGIMPLFFFFHLLGISLRVGCGNWRAQRLRSQCHAKEFLGIPFANQFGARLRCSPGAV